MHLNLANLLELFIQSQDPLLTERTIFNKKHYTELFLEFLDHRDCHDFSEFDINSVYEFIVSLDYASQTISNIQFVLRDFFNIMYEKGLSPVDGKRVFPVIFTNKRDRILSYYQTDEIKALINAIDITEKNGVRNKCWILLAAQTGLRARDILQLKFSEIRWDKHIIQKTQQKTKIAVTVILPKNLEFLLIDYIKNFRPQSASEYVFICEESGERYCDTMLFQVVNRYFRRADITIGNRKHGPHALRHSLATNLLKNNAPMPVITGILGHKNLNTTSKYLSIDIDTLRRCCLEVPDEK
jgi:site-specific recombinase XerD